MTAMRARSLSHGLAYALLDGAWTLAEMYARAKDAFDAAPRWLRPLCRRILKRFPVAPFDTDELAESLGASTTTCAPSFSTPLEATPLRRIDRSTRIIERTC